MSKRNSSRRDFLKQAGALAVAGSAPPLLSAFSQPEPARYTVYGVAANRAVVKNRAPLQQNQFHFLPLTAIRPTGWLCQQLEVQARGLSGHLDEVWPDVGPNSGWLGGKGENWERGPYFLDGLIPLAYLLDDAPLKAKAQKWMDWTLGSQQPNGMFGPATNDDWWPRMVMLKALTQYQEATGDPRVIPLMERYFAYQLRQLSPRPLRDWGKYRWQDEAVSVLWLYNRDGDGKLLELARLLQQQGHDWRREFENFPYTYKTSVKQLEIEKAETKDVDIAMNTHGVNNAMGLKASPVSWLLSGDDADRQGIYHQLQMLDTYHGLPNGMFSADEHFAGLNPSQGTELCAVVEAMFSLERAVAVLGDAVLADRLERIAYNALPGTFTDDMWAHQYDQQPNQIQCSLLQRDWSTNGPESNLFGLAPTYGCCTANLHQGWPKLTSSLWMATDDGGLAAIIYAPNTVHTLVGGKIPVAISEETESPFGERVTLRIDPISAVEFPLALRVPGWARDSSISVNGKPADASMAGTFGVIKRKWQRGDRIELRFPMKPRVSRWYRNSIAVERGPIVYSLELGPVWKKLKDRGPASDWEADPSRPWNYALAVDVERPDASVEVVERASAEPPFTVKGTRVELHVRGRAVPEWKVENGSAGPLPESPVASHEPEEKLTLVPYGAAKLRITAFPQLRKA